MTTPGARSPRPASSRDRPLATWAASCGGGGSAVRAVCRPAWPPCWSGAASRSTGGEGTMPYYANVGPKAGPVKYRDLPTGSIGVLESPDPGAPGPSRGSCLALLGVYGLELQC